MKTTMAPFAGTFPVGTPAAAAFDSH